MLRKNMFILKEVYRNIKNNLPKSLVFFICSFVNLTIIAFNLIIILNMEQVRNIFAVFNIEVSTLRFNFLIQVIQYFSFFLILVFFIFLNYRFLSYLITYYQEEIRLIKRLNADIRIGKKAIFYTGALINVLAGLSACYVVEKIYTLFFNNLAKIIFIYSLDDYFIISINHYMFLLLLSLIIVFLLTNYLFWFFQY